MSTVMVGTANTHYRVALSHGGPHSRVVRAQSAGFTIVMQSVEKPVRHYTHVIWGCSYTGIVSRSDDTMLGRVQDDVASLTSRDHNHTH